MSGKYSAEWWEKITGASREMAARHDPSRLVDDLIQATANGKRSRGAKSGKPRAARLENGVSEGLYVD
jgi:hypothetical protein